MKESQRYATSHLPESQFEPGSNDSVLKNKLGITRPHAMDRREKDEQLKVMEELTGLFDSNHRFNSNDICKMHKMWLGNIYEWAGRYRQVKMSKDDFTFAFPEQIAQLMTDFEKGPLHEVMKNNNNSNRKSPSLSISASNQNICWSALNVLWSEDKYARLLLPHCHRHKGAALGYGLKFWPEEFQKLKTANPHIALFADEDKS